MTVDYRVEPPSSTQSVCPSDGPNLPMHLVHRALFGDEEAKAECLRGFQLVNVGLPWKLDPAKPSTIEYFSKEIESSWTHLEVFTKHSSECMIRHDRWEVCTHIPKQSIMPSQLLTDLQGKDLLGVPGTHPMVGLCTVLDHTDDLKGSRTNQVVRMWLAHFEQIGKFQTTMGEADREALHITDVKTVQAKINASSREKVLHAAVEDTVLQV